MQKIGKSYAFKHSLCKKWTILVLGCFTTLSSNFCKDNIGVLHDSLNAHFKHLGNDFEYFFGLTYSLYAIPNLILPFIGGILCTKFGLHTMYFIYSILILIGQFILCLGCKFQSMETLLIGRTIYGLGSECVFLSQTSILLKWFDKSEMGLPTAITLSFCRLIGSLNDIISPMLVENGINPTKSLWLGFFISAIGFFSLLILIKMDRDNDNELNITEDETEKNNNLTSYSINYIKNLNIMFWLICILYGLLSGSFLAYKLNAAGFLTHTYLLNLNNNEKAQKLAGIIVSIPFLISIPLLPIIGYFIDIFGHRANLLFISCILSFVSYLMAYYLNPFYHLVLLGIASAIFSSVMRPAILVTLKKSEEVKNS